MAVPKCPICHRDALPKAGNPAFPFCSRRCRLVDLGKWLGEEYRVAGDPIEEDEDGPTAPPRTGNREDVH